MNPDTVAAEVSSFMEGNLAGWIREADAVAFFQERCSFMDVCIALSQLKEEKQLNKMLDFLESIARFELVGSHLSDPSAQAFVAAAVQSPSERLRGVIATALGSVKRSSFPFEVNDETLFCLLCDEDTGISVRISKLGLDWLQSTIKDPAEKFQFASKIAGIYKARSNRLNETQEFRFISLFIQISRLDPNIFNHFKNEGLFDPIVTRFLSTDTDLLVKLGSLSLIEPLGQFEQGQRYLADANVLGALEKELSGPLADSATLISVLLTMSSIVPYVSSLEQVRCILVYPQAKVPLLISQFIVSANNAERMSAMKALALISHASGKSEPVDNYLRSSWRPLKEIVFALSDVDVEVINTALDSLRELVKNWDRNPFMESVESQLSVIREIRNTFKRHPFPACRCLVYSLLSAIVRYTNISELGLSEILSEPSPIRAALLDFQSESDYDSRMAKCDLVRVLVNAELTKKFFKPDPIENFIEFANKGLEWVPVSRAKDEMATDAL